MTSMWSETKPIGTTTTPATPCRGQLLEVVVDVGLEPRHVRRPGPRAEDQLVRRSGGRSPARDPLDDLVGDAAVLGDVGAAVGPAGVVHRRRDRVGDEQQVRVAAGRRRGSSASAASVASTIGSTKPGWLK